MAQNPKLVARTLAAAVFSEDGEDRHRAVDAMMPLVTSALIFAWEEGLLSAGDKMDALAAQIETLKVKNAVLESFRPHWAQGYSSDSVAAQTMNAALASLWGLLGATSQTEAMEKLHNLLAVPAP